MKRRRIARLLCVSVLGAPLWGAPAQNDATPGPSVAPAGSIQQLQQRLAAQEEEIKKLQQAIEEQKTLLEQSLKNSAAAVSISEGTSVVPASSTRNDKPVKIVPAVNVAHTNLSPSPGWQRAETAQSPLSVTIGNTTFSPLGFVDTTFYGRSSNTGSGIGSNFGSIPYNTSPSEHVSEENFSQQNSRIGFRVDSNVLGAKVLGYFEMDFLGGNASSNVQVTSNSNTFRMRNAFVDIRKNKLEVMAGQDWSLATPNRQGLSPLPSEIFYTQNMDTNYQAGLVWARQSGVRVILHPTQDFAFGVSLENPQQYVGGSGGGGAIAIPSSSPFSSIPGTQVNNGTANAVANPRPDIIIKAAYDGHIGEKLIHVEAGGIIRGFHYAEGIGTKPMVYNTYTATAGSGEVNANLQLVKNLRLIANTFFGQGNGRYVFGLAPDFTIAPDGSISEIRTYSTVDGFEANIAKDTLLYGYYGGVYIGRDVSYDPVAKAYYGYGIPTSSAGTAEAQNRAIQEGTIGMVQTFWKNANYGALSLITQYSYLTRAPWYLVAGTPKDTHTNMYWVDLRYTLP